MFRFCDHLLFLFLLSFVALNGLKPQARPVRLKRLQQRRRLTVHRPEPPLPLGIAGRGGRGRRHGTSCISKQRQACSTVITARWPPDHGEDSTNSSRPSVPSTARGGGGNQAGGGGGGGGSKVTCQCCGKKNHSRSECRHLQDGCTECGKTGHLWEVCNQREDFHICPNKAIKGNRKADNGKGSAPLKWTDAQRSTAPTPAQAAGTAKTGGGKGGQDSGKGRVEPKPWYCDNSFCNRRMEAWETKCGGCNKQRKKEKIDHANFKNLTFSKKEEVVMEAAEEMSIFTILI